MEKPTFKKLVLMNMQQLTNFPYIEEDFDALTDYGLLCKVVDYLNQLIANDNLQNETIVSLYDAFESLQDYVNTYLVDMEDLKEAVKLIEDTIEVLEGLIEKNAQDIVKTKNDLTALIGENYTTLKNYVDYQDAILDEKITNIQIGAISVYNPTNGLLQPLQTVINDLYGAGNKDGLSATEFDALDLTASEFDAYEITAYEFDSNGKTILV